VRNNLKTQTKHNETSQEQENDAKKQFVKLAKEEKEGSQCRIENKTRRNKEESRRIFKKSRKTERWKNHQKDLINGQECLEAKPFRIRVGTF